MPETHIQDVWASNFYEEMKKLIKLAERFNVIAMVSQLTLRIQNFLELLPLDVNSTSDITLSNNANTFWSSETSRKQK
jgi:hypothetical protein